MSAGRAGPAVAVADLSTAAAARGTVVVVDVLRAFTTAAHALAAGARELLPVAAVDEALRLRATGRVDLAMGEVGGLPVEGFDLSNSPAALDGRRLDGRRIAFRTTNGTQGIVRSAHADAVFAASFVVAAATARAVLATGPAAVTIVVTGDGGDGGEEDRALAAYLGELLEGRAPDPAPFLARARASATAARFLDPGQPAFPAADLDRCLAVDRFDLALPVTADGGHLVLRAAR